MTDDFLFDPRKLIGGPSWHCPKCQEHELGTLSIHNRRIVRKCRNCLYSAAEELPQLTKAVVYLDQMVFSNLAKSLDPVWQNERGVQDEYWLRVFDTLERILKLQLIVCPFSRVHERESIVAAHPDMLRRLYEHFSAKTEFVSPANVDQIQMQHAFPGYLHGKEPDYSILLREKFIRGGVNEWQERLTVTARLPGADPNPDIERTARRRSYDAFKKTFAGWCEAKPRFDDVYQFERRGKADTIVALVKQHVEEVRRYERMVSLSITGEVEPPEAVWNPRIEISIFMALLHQADDCGVSPRDQAEVVTQFLMSPAAMDAPSNDISALLMASLARRASAGQRRTPSRGMWLDITAIASYLPYCSAMFLDDECASLLKEGPLDVQIGYPTKVFSNRSREEFLVYLRSLESEAGKAHEELIVSTYGHAWLEPYREILVRERARMR